jgi:hypothetical protein
MQARSDILGVVRGTGNWKAPVDALLRWQLTQQKLGIYECKSSMIISDKKELGMNCLRLQLLMDCLYWMALLRILQLQVPNTAKQKEIHQLK